MNSITHVSLWDGESQESEEFLVAVGVETVVVSADGGETWSVVPEPANGWGTLRRVFSTTERVYAVGDAGAAWSSATPGGVWTIEMVGTSADLLTGDVSEGDLLLVAASDNTLVLRDSEGWQVRPLELDGELIDISGLLLLTSTGAVYELDYTYATRRWPVTFDFAVKAMVVGYSEVIAVGEGGRAQRVYYTPVCEEGRPLIDEGQSVLASLIQRDDWLAEIELAAEVDEPSALRWAKAGLDEHASIGSFAVHQLELASLGAPAELLGEVQRAMADEVRHARLAFGLARRFGGVARGPGPLAITPTMLARCGDPQAIALALFEQGCVNETLAACEASVAAQTHEDPEVRRVLESIADNERRHAALAWKSLRWLIDRHPEVRGPLRQRLPRLAASVAATEVERKTLHELILPLALELS